MLLALIAQADPVEPWMPAWVRDTGARKTPDGAKVFSTNRYGAAGDGVTVDTRAIQRAIDECAAAGGGRVTFAPGQYVTGALFLKSGVHLHVEAGVTLLASLEDADYPRQPTRVAGIEMTWPAGLINVCDQRNVEISGGGTIDGRGEKWWQRFEKLRERYQPRGLRWAADYDAERVRMLVVTRSRDVTLEGLELRRAGFWTVQILYSEHVTASRLKIRDNTGPSTDGVDIDSSRYVRVSNCDIDNNDDDICLKAGRDADGLRVNRPTEHVFIHDNLTRRGSGVISFGSETSGGIRHVVAYRNRGLGTKEGLRFKSARTCGGVIEDIWVRDLRLEKVPLAFTFTLDWYPSYSYARIPADVQDPPAHWHVLCAPVVPAERGLAEFKNITIEDVQIQGARSVFSATGLPERPLQDIRFRNIEARAGQAGTIEHARDWTLENVRITAADGQPVRILQSTNIRQTP